ncbi:E3 ubiquitin-protein ligase DCST1 [Pholidichthys leucotaenia]
MTADAARTKAPHSTVERFVLTSLPPAVHHFLYSQSEEVTAARLLGRALFGAVSSTVLFLGIAHNLPLTSHLTAVTGAAFVAICAVGAALSLAFRCLTLLTFPSVLGSRGRAFLMLLVLSVLHAGPVSNIQRNAESVALSLSCNLDLQLRHAKLMWRSTVTPYVLILQELMDDQAGFQAEAVGVNSKFQDLRDELVRQYGYDDITPQGHGGKNNTQKEFVAKTLMQCDSVVAEGIRRCSDWFRQKWEECMKTIGIPIISHIFCVSMKFDFLCDIMKVMTPWCKENIPVEQNFGQLFDRLSSSVYLLSKEFRAELQVEEAEQQEVLGGGIPDLDFTAALKESLLTLKKTTERLLGLWQLLLSFTFITIFTQAFSYLRGYRRDICFDNIYITAYFRQIDARRRKAGKRFLFPLRREEKRSLIQPCSLRIHPEELRQVTSGVFQFLSLSLLSAVLLTVDFSFFHILDIVNRHTFTQFNLTSDHKLEVRVGGASMMARLLRTTVSAFNSSSELQIHSDNRECMSPPSSLPVSAYISCVSCLLLLLLFSCLQVYTNRLRRVIATFFHPKREKKRVLYLYNLHIHRRVYATDRERIFGRARHKTVFQHLIKRFRRLCSSHHSTQEVSESSEGTRYASG